MLIIAFVLTKQPQHLVVMPIWHLSVVLKERGGSLPAVLFPFPVWWFKEFSTCV
jgi:hypothetical protein